MSATITRTESIEALGGEEAMRLAANEYDRFRELVRSLSSEDWDRPTDCERWTVKDILSHMTAMNEAMTSFREMRRQQRAGKSVARQEGLSTFDGWTELQVRELRSLRSSELVRRYESAIPGVLAVRQRTTPLRLLRFPSPPYGWMS